MKMDQTITIRLSQKHLDIINSAIQDENREGKAAAFIRFLIERYNSDGDLVRQTYNMIKELHEEVVAGDDRHY